MTKKKLYLRAMHPMFITLGVIFIPLFVLSLFVGVFTEQAIFTVVAAMELILCGIIIAAVSVYPKHGIAVIEKQEILLNRSFDQDTEWVNPGKKDMWTAGGWIVFIDKSYCYALHRDAVAGLGEIKRQRYNRCVMEVMLKNGETCIIINPFGDEKLKKIIQWYQEGGEVSFV